MTATVLLLSDQHNDPTDLIPEFPLGPWHTQSAPLKTTQPDELIPIHPDLLLVDATGDPGVAEEVTRQLSLAWEIGLPPILVVVDESNITSFRYEVGADDFVLSGAPGGEIAARMNMLFRRSGRGEDPTVIKIGDLVVNPENYQVYVRGRPLDLTYKEFELLKFLSQRPGRVCDRDMLLQEVWGYDYYGGTRTVDVHIRRLRAKLGAEHETLIETIRNVGYRLVPRPRDR
jgi:DNA-binding response OmpR family regulator